MLVNPESNGVALQTVREFERLLPVTASVVEFDLQIPRRANQMLAYADHIEETRDIAGRRKPFALEGIEVRGLKRVLADQELYTEHLTRQVDEGRIPADRAERISMSPQVRLRHLRDLHDATQGIGKGNLRDNPSPRTTTKSDVEMPIFMHPDILSNNLAAQRVIEAMVEARGLSKRRN